MSGVKIKCYGRSLDTCLILIHKAVHMVQYRIEAFSLRGVIECITYADAQMPALEVGLVELLD